MSENFYELYLPTYENVYAEMRDMLDTGVISWDDKGNHQICLNTTINAPDDIRLGRGSLIYDWENKIVDESGNIQVKKYDKPLREEDFTQLNGQFKDTVFEKMYRVLEKNYKLGRVRLMKSLPKTCLSWHTDTTPRIHYTIKTQTECFMIIDNEVKHLEQDKWWFTNTILPHTAFNGSKEERIHLVATIL